ncbi:hypothetical protein EX895_002443 [Sporisorium graminicola]|uniref:Small monomeric GTPase n=1 Tax=Sporisorium graminicola TaxID=280036 RepID=A0A4U7KUX8_9BASI|nr:hypothetical protein EX895_002443 [Sporisorium graminicola]TKY88455.1 hypothetical protein EX895_002443 [Sporisorium graminicola]
MSSQSMLYKLIVLGSAGVGKTALTIQFCLHYFADTCDPTIEDCYRKQTVIDDDPCMFEVLDTAGQPQFAVLRDQWIRYGDAFLIVFSVTDRRSFDIVESFRTQILRFKDQKAHQVPIIIVGNMCDMVHEREVLR